MHNFAQVAQFCTTGRCYHDPSHAPGLFSPLLITLWFGAIALSASAVQEWLRPFTRPSTGNPVLVPNRDSVFTDPILNARVHWEALHTFNPAAIVRNDKICLLYRAEDDSGQKMIGGHTSRIGLAESTDGVHFVRHPAPVLFPANDDQKDREWPGGCEDPRVVEAEDGTYVVTYTQWNRKTTAAAIATSPDLVTWTKHGPMLAKAKNGKYARLQYKSASIVTRLVHDRLHRRQNQRLLLDVLG